MLTKHFTYARTLGFGQGLWNFKYTTSRNYNTENIFATIAFHQSASQSEFLLEIWDIQQEG